MNPDKTKELLEEYPKIFGINKIFRFECGDGWAWLIESLCNQLQFDVNHNNQPQIVAAQVKEKFGRLNFITPASTDKQHAQIMFAETMSARICEMCGATENIGQTEGWIITICKYCAEEVDRPWRAYD